MFELEFQNLRLLSGMWMIAAGIHLELFDQPFAQSVLWQHPLDGEADDVLRLFIHQLLGGYCRQPSGITAVPVVGLLLHLASGEDNLIRIDDDDIVPGVHMGGKQRMMLAANSMRDSACQSAQYDALGIDDIPFASLVRFFGAICVFFHRIPLPIIYIIGYT